MRLAIILITSIYCSIANAKDLNMLVWSDDLAPIIYWNPATRSHQGIVIDIFNSLPKEHKINLNFIMHNRQRGELALYEGDADVSIFSKEWMQHPEKLVYSEPIYVHREYLYANAPIETIPMAELVMGKLICTRRGYNYPKLNAFFDQSIALRVDSRFELTQFKMLRKKRCDYVITNEFVGEWLIEVNGWKDKVFHSAEAIDVVNFTLAFHPNIQSTVNVLNRHIEKIKNTGVLAEYINTQRSSVANIKQATKLE